VKAEEKLICFALKEEAAPFRKIATGTVASAQAVSILLTGIAIYLLKIARRFSAGFTSQLNQSSPGGTTEPCTHSIPA
jgi:hypothetical protein